MTKLVGRLICWGVATIALAAISAVFLYPQLFAQRHPREAVAQSYLTRELGDSLSPAQERTVRAAVRYDPLLAMLVAQTRHDEGAAPWEALAALPGETPSPTLTVQRLALDAALAGKLTKRQAAGFVDSTLSLWALLHDASPADSQQLLDATQRLPVSEYANAAADPSYALIVERLDPRYRATFRDNQAALTPLLAMAAPEEWNGLVEKFERAQPRVGELLADPKLGRTYAIVYMLQFDAVHALQQAGVSETEAIEFAGINSAAIGEVAKVHPDWAAWAAKLKQEAGPDNRPLIRAACADPAVFWLVCHDDSPGKASSLAILRRYAGTDLPAILLKYGKTPALLGAAIESLTRFDNELDSNPARRQSAARFLNRYQDDDAFKDALAQHGAVLIPALSAGGPDALAQIRSNPNDISKWVNKQGQPRKTPLWTYIPGGNIVYAINEKLNGRTLTWGELGWAAVDTVLLVPVVGGATVGVKALMAGERTAGEALVETSAKTVGEGAAEEIAAGGTEAGTAALAKGAGAAAIVGAEVESRSLLRVAGVKLVQGFSQTLRATVALAMRYPKTTLAISVPVIFALFPDVGHKIQELLISGAGSSAKTLGQVMAALPGGVIEGLWDEIQSLAARHPLLAPVYYSLFFLLILANVAVSAYLLKKLAHPVYAWIVAPVVSFTRGMVVMCRTLMGWATPRRPR